MAVARPPEIIGLGFSVLGGALVSVYPPGGWVFVGIGILLMLWGVVRAGRERRASGKRVIEPSYLVMGGLIAGAICLLVAATGYGLTVYHRQARAASTQSAGISPKLLAEPAIEWDGIGDIFLTGKATRRGSNQIIYLDYGSFGAGYTTILSGGFNVERRIEITRLEHFVRDQGLRVLIGTVTPADGNQQILQWGEKRYNNTKVGITHGSYAGRVIIVDDAGNEERYPFLILSTSRDSPQKPIIVGPNVFVFFEKWVTGIY